MGVADVTFERSEQAPKGFDVGLQCRDRRVKRKLDRYNVAAGFCESNT
jgi:hypothetical protein